MEILAYNVKSKKKETMLKAFINKNGNKCFAKGESETGQKLCVAIGVVNAEAAIEAGIATKGTGWDE